MSFPALALPGLVLSADTRGDEKGAASFVHVARMPDALWVYQGLTWSKLHSPVAGTEILDDVDVPGDQPDELVTGRVPLPMSPSPFLGRDAHEPSLLAVGSEAAGIVLQAVFVPGETIERHGDRAEAEIDGRVREHEEVVGHIAKASVILKGSRKSPAGEAHGELTQLLAWRSVVAMIVRVGL